MNISSVNNTTSFCGLLGHKTGYSAVGLVELREVNRYYPFLDEPPMQANENFRKMLFWNCPSQKQKWAPVSAPLIGKEFTVEPKLPFTKAEFERYKALDGNVRTPNLLDAKMQKIEKFLALDTKHGLFSSYANQYVEKPTTLRSIVKQIMRVLGHHA